MKSPITPLPILAILLALSPSCLATALAPISSDLLPRADPPPASSDLLPRDEPPPDYRTYPGDHEYIIGVFKDDRCTTKAYLNRTGDTRKDSECILLEAGAKRIHVNVSQGLGVRMYYDKNTACNGQGYKGGPDYPPIPVAERGCMSLADKDWNNQPKTIWSIKYFTIPGI